MPPLIGLLKKRIRDKTVPKKQKAKKSSTNPSKDALFDEIQGLFLKCFAIDDKIKSIVDEANKEVEELLNEKKACDKRVAEIIRPGMN